MDEMNDFKHNLDRFVVYLQVEKRASRCTISNYRSDLERFVAFAQEQGAGDVLVCNITQLLIRNYLTTMHAKEYSYATINRSLAAMRSFFLFLCKQTVIDANPCENLHALKRKKTVVPVLTSYEISDLLGLPDQSDLGRRDLAVLELLYATGIRASELVKLATVDLDCFNGCAVISDSEGEERIVPIGNRAVRALEQYIRQSRPQLYRNNTGAPHDYAFVNSKGGPLTDRSIRRILSKYVDMLALEQFVSPATIRQTFAVHMLNNGADFCSVQEMLGQLSLSQMLPLIEKERIRSVYKSAHPRA